MSKSVEVIALATINLDGSTLRGKIPAPVVKALKAKAGAVLIFERQPNGAIVVRKATTAERKAGSSKKAGQK